MSQDHSLYISLRDMRFKAFHGLFPEERQKGNDFVVNLELSYIPEVNLVTELSQTIDYAEIFSIVKMVMDKPVDLLETVVQTIGLEIKKQFSQVRTLEVTVEKLNPPIPGFSGSTAVKFKADYLSIP